MTEEKLIDALLKQFPGTSKSTIREWVEYKRVHVNGTIAKSVNQLVQENDTVELLKKQERADGLFPIVYQDDQIVVIDKPAGLLSVSTDFEKQKTAHAILKKHLKLKQLFVIHRLDEETSGLLMFALTEDAFIRLKAMFQAHDLERQYVAIVEGAPKQSEGVWKCHLWEDAAFRVHPTQDPLKGELAITHYKCLNKKGIYSRLELTLETGKKHQIRVHCKMEGHPIAGDKRYGAKTYSIGRLALHAKRLAFLHPMTLKPIDLTSPPPASFDKLA